jgi:hypothetical protein
MEKHNKPNFLVVGAAKSGTTSLFHYLKQHADVYMPEVKECRFFSQLPKNFNGLGAEFFPNSGITDAKEYFGLFEGSEDQVCGDISNDYLYYHEESIKNIKKYLDDDVKILIILRNPIDRAYSNYMHAVRDDWENLTFEESIIQETFRIKENWGWPYHYIKAGFYFNQVNAYFKNFKNVKVFLYDDFQEEKLLMKNIFNFLELDTINYNEGVKEYNASGYPKNKFIHKVVNNDFRIKRLLRPIAKKILPKNILDNIKSKNLEKIPLKKETRCYLEKIYLKDISNLSHLINRDLTHWIKNEM